MAKLAAYDSSQGDPAPVIGWYDTDIINYQTLPPETLEMTEDEWAARRDGHWAVSGGSALVPYTPPPPPDQVIMEHINQGLTLHPSGAVLSLRTDAVAALREVARDAASGLGLPNGAETFEALTVAGTAVPLSEAEVIAAYKGARDVRALLLAQRAVIERGEVPAWPEQTITL